MVRLLLVVLAVLAGSTTGWADAESDCRQRRDAELRVRACGAIIDGPGYSASQKALAHRNRGHARADAGALAEALADLDAAVRLDPTDWQALAERGEVRLAQGDARAAIGDLGQAIAHNPRSGALLVARGHALMVAGDLQGAIGDFTSAIAMEPENAVAFNNRGLAHRKAGDLDRAIADYASAIQINPIYGLAYANRGYAYEAKGAKAQAVDDFRRALLVSPTLAGARDALERLGAGQHAAGTDALIREGRLLAERYCGWCHAVGATGSSPNPKAPELRRLQQRHPLLDLRKPMTRGIAAPHDEMPKLPLSAAEVDKIVAYVDSLAGRP